MAVQTVFECDSCGYQPSGYTKNELTDEGWVWWTINKTKSFVMCDGCVKRYTPLWESRAEPKAA